MQTTMVLTQRIMMFMQVTKLLISGNMKGLSWTRLYTHLATISRGAMYVHKMKEKVFDLSELPFSSFICTLLSQSGMVEGTWALASDKPCISQSGTLGWTGFKSARGGEIQGMASGTAVSRCPNDNVILYLSTSPSWAHEVPKNLPSSSGLTFARHNNIIRKKSLPSWISHRLRTSQSAKEVEAISRMKWNGCRAGKNCGCPLPVCKCLPMGERVYSSGVTFLCLSVCESVLCGEMCVLWTQWTRVETGSSLTVWSPATHLAVIMLITTMFWRWDMW